MKILNSMKMTLRIETFGSKIEEITSLKIDDLGVNLIKFLIIILLIFSTINAIGQNAKVDSLKTMIKTCKRDTIKSNAYAELLKILKVTRPDDVRPLFNEGFEFAKLHKRAKNQADMQLSFAISFGRNGDLDSCLKYLDAAKLIYEKIGDINKIADVYNNMGNVYRNKSFYNLSVDHFFKSLRIKEKLNGSKNEIALTLGNISNVYFMMNDLTKALDYAIQAKNIFQYLPDNEYKANNFIALNAILEKSNQLDSSLYYAKKAEVIFLSFLKNPRKQPAYTGLAYVYHNFGVLYRKLKQYPTAIHFENKSMMYYDSLKMDSMAKFYNIWNLAMIYRESGQLKEAKKLALETYTLAQKSKVLYFKTEACKELSWYYKANGEFQNSMIYFEEYKNYSDSLMDQKKQQNIAEYEVVYHKEQGEMALQRMALENKENEATILKLWLIIGSVFFGVSILALVISLIRKRQIRTLIVKIKENEKARNFDYFHSLGNMLSSISAGMQTNKLSATEKSLLELGTEMRQFSHQQYSPKLERVNMKELLKDLMVRQQEFIEGEFEYNDAIPNLLWKKVNTPLRLAIHRTLQELLQNTSKHSNASLVELTLSTTKNEIHIFYKDNGQGAMLNEIKGKGLKSIEDNVGLFHGHIEIETSPNEGFLCAIDLPYKRFWIF